MIAAAKRYHKAVNERARLIADIVREEANLSLKLRPTSTP